MGVVDEVALAEEFFHFFRGQSMPGLDGRTAGHRMEHMVEQIAARHLAFVLNELFREVFHDANELPRGISVGCDMSKIVVRRTPAIRNRSPSTDRATPATPRIRSRCIRWIQESTAVDAPRLGQNAVAKMFIQNAFVQRVLVDDFQTRVAGDNDVAVVNLDGSEFGSVCCCSLDRPGLFG